MKKMLLILLLGVSAQIPQEVKAQANEAAQLALNIEKLAQLKSILTTLEKGFTIVSKGYGTIKSLTEGNFNLHKLFLDGLLDVSPAVKKYKKVALIVEDQIVLVKACKSAAKRLDIPALFGPGELNYMTGVFEQVTAGSLKNLDELLNVITAKTLRMSDDERLTAIDRIYEDMEEKLGFVHAFDENCTLLALGRSRQKNQVSGMAKWYGLQDGQP